MRSISVLLAVITLLVFPLAAPGGTKAPSKGGGIVKFKGEMTYQQQKIALKVAEAIRSGNLQEIGLFTRNGEDPETIRRFWEGVDTLSTLQFRARATKRGILLEDSTSGMSSCSIIKGEGGFFIEECIFNDGY